jgi:O-antigen ligase
MYKNSAMANIKTGLLAFFMSIFILLLPLKFGNPAVLPEASYFPRSLPTWTFFSWPPILFSLISGIILFLTIVLLLNRPHRIYRDYSNLAIPFLWIALSLVSLLGFIKSSCLDFAYLECIYLFGLTSFAFAIFRFLELASEPHRNWLIYAIVISSILIAVYGIYQYHYGLDETKNYVITNILEKGVTITSDFKNRLFDKNNLVFSTFAISNSFAAHLLLILPLCLWFVFEKTKNGFLKHALTIVFAIILFYALFLTGSRAAFLSFFCAGALLMFILPFPKKVKISCLVTGAVIVCLVTLYFTRKGSMLDTINVRLDYYQVAFKMLVDNPITGGGWGDFFHNYTFLKDLANTEAPHMPHNFVLSMGSQAGILAFLCAIAILVYPVLVVMRRIYKAHNRQFYRQFSFPLLLGWSAWSIHSLLDINIQIPATVATGILVSALMLLSNNNQPVDSDITNTHTTFTTFLNRLFFRNWVRSHLVTAQLRKAEKSNILPFKIKIGLPIVWTLLALILATTTIILSLNRISGDIALQNLNRLSSPFDITNLEFTKNKTPMKEINRSLKTCTTLLPYSPFPWAMAGNTARKRKLWKLSEKYYREAVLRSPKRAAFYYDLALAQFKLGKIKQAVLNLKMAKKLFPFKYEQI